MSTSKATKTVRKSKRYLDNGIIWTKIISLGKFAWNGCRKVNEVEIEIQLKYDRTKDQYKFSVTGNVFNSKKTDVIAGGQCLNEVWEFYRAEPFKTIYGWWKKYHLNDLHAGTVEQERYLEEHKREVDEYIKNQGTRGLYDAQKYVLKQAGLYEVIVDGELYKYGHSWLYYPIPEEDLEAIINYLEEE